MIRESVEFCCGFVLHLRSLPIILLIIYIRTENNTVIQLIIVYIGNHCDFED